VYLITEIINQYGFYIGQFLLLTLGLVFFFLAKLFFNKLLLATKKTSNHFDEVFVLALKKPLSFALVFGYLLIISVQFRDYLPSLGKFIFLVNISLVFWFLLRLSSGIEKKIIETNNKLQADNVTFLTRIIRAFFWLIFIIIVIQAMGYSISAILAFGGVGGLVVGMAAKDVLSNMFSGFILQIDKPFNTGDWVRIKEHNIEGVVEKINWRMTRIRTFSKNPVYIPNSIFSSSPIETPSRMLNRRIKETIGLRYADMTKVKTILKEIETMLKTHPDIDNEKIIMVNLNQFSAYSVDFFIYLFTKTKDWVTYHKIKEDVLLKVSDIIEKNEAEIAFPTTQIEYKA
jgi:MscS family membrane protein